VFVFDAETLRKEDQNKFSDFLAIPAFDPIMTASKRVQGASETLSEI